MGTIKHHTNKGKMIMKTKSHSFTTLWLPRHGHVNVNEGNLIKLPNATTRPTIKLLSLSMLKCLAQMSMLVLMLLPCRIYSQQGKTPQELTKSYKELLNNSEIIVDAQVVSKESQWTKGHEYIHTLIKFKVIQTIKGVVEDNEITFDQPGGRVGDTVTDVSSSKSYSLNERAIYYFKNKNLNTYLVESGRHVINHGLVNIGSQRVDADLYKKVLKQSVTDTSILSKFFIWNHTVEEAIKTKPAHKAVILPSFEDFVKKDSVKLEDTVKTNTTTQQSHPMLKRMPRPWKSAQDSVVMSKKGKPEIKTTIDGEVK
jgi:hypothetical protein